MNRQQPRTAAAIQARRERSAAALLRIERAITTLDQHGATITVAAVARTAGVSRTFLYESPQARSLVDGAAGRAGDRRATRQHHQVQAHEANWRERALNAEAALKRVEDEILTQRGRIGELLGEIRSMSTQWTEEDLLRITRENTELRTQAREGATALRRAEERLAAARENNRFLDKRLAHLEAELAQQAAADILTLPTARTDTNL